MPQNNNLVKQSGQVFTPRHLVCTILDFAGYKGFDILGKHIIDNSCGDGAFLCEVARRYATNYIRKHGNTDGLATDLATYIHGIEIESLAWENCLANLNALMTENGWPNVEWDVVKGSALDINKYNGRMDFVVGNPPYVRVHNLADNYTAVKNFTFAQDGMTDLYLVFYELGLRMLSNNGRLCYISPGSWLSSVAAQNMREYILKHRNLVGLIDLGHYQAFEGATTYTMITLFDGSEQRDEIDYYTYNPETSLPDFQARLSYDDIYICGNFYLGRKEELDELKHIKTDFTKSYCVVKNGFATLADKVFILNVPFKELTIPILKASTGKWNQGFYPYDCDGKPLAKDKIFSCPDVALYLEENKKELLKGKSEQNCDNWYLYGRTQALKDVSSDKIAINIVIKNIGSIKLNEVKAGAGIYSGLYILTKVSFQDISEILKSEDFITYLRLLKKYKSGGYYTFNSKDLEQYLNYKITKYGKSSKR